MQRRGPPYELTEIFPLDPMPASQGNNGSPLVSVIIPTYNSARYVGQAVQSALAQTETRHEVIVVDDGSTDKTQEVLSKFGGQIKYLYQENRGPSAARNAGIKVAKGKYICFLDADDLWASNKLELQLGFMERYCDVGLGFAYRDPLMESGLPFEPFLARKRSPEVAAQSPVPEAFIKLVMSSFIPTSTAMVRKECFEKAGLFDESLRSVEDRDMWMRISAHFRIARLPWVLSKKRVHDSNISSDHELAILSHVRVLEKNRRLFPEKAPVSVWNSELARSYFKVGSCLLLKNQRLEARRAGLRSLKNRPTIKAFALVVLTFMSVSAIRYALRIRRSMWQRKWQKDKPKVQWITPRRSSL